MTDRLFEDNMPISKVLDTTNEWLVRNGKMNAKKLPAGNDHQSWYVRDFIHVLRKMMR
jgi:hypothetical protein